MTVSFIKDRELSDFVATMMKALPVYGPVAKRSRFAFERLVGPIPEAGLTHAALVLRDLGRARIDVKGTSAGPRACAGPGRCVVSAHLSSA
mgnify:CR=1 FL=1